MNGSTLRFKTVQKKLFELNLSSFDGATGDRIYDFVAQNELMGLVRPESETFANFPSLAMIRITIKETTPKINHKLLNFLC